MEKKTYEAGASAYTLGVANSILNYADEYGQASKAELENMPKDASVDQWKKKNGRNCRGIYLHAQVFSYVLAGSKMSE